MPRIILTGIYRYVEDFAQHLHEFNNKRLTLYHASKMTKILATLSLLRGYCGGIRSRNFPTASRHKALYLQSVRPTCLMYHRYSYGSFAEYWEEGIRGRMQPSRTSNKHVRSEGVEGQQRKESVWFRTKDSEANTIRDTWLLTLDS